eukprot:3104067-Rhodomonas_salina.1
MPDWPNAPGVLRDGSAAGSAASGTQVADCLPGFRVRYMATEDLGPAPGGKTTNSAGGDCHMARGAERAPSDAD